MSKTNNNVLGTLWLYSQTSSKFASREELSKAFPDAAEAKIKKADLLGKFMGRKNVIRITPFLASAGDSATEKQFITENRMDRAMSVKWEGNGWEARYGGGEVASLYEAFSCLNENCKNSLKETGWYKMQEFFATTVTDSKNRSALRKMFKSAGETSLEIENSQ